MTYSQPNTEVARVISDEPHAVLTRDPVDVLVGIASKYGSYTLVLFLIILIVRSYVQSTLKPLWYDEIFSLIVAIQPTWHRMVQAMAGDGNPPLYGICAHLLVRTFGQSRFLIRLPSLIGFVGAVAGTFVFVKREAGALLGILAVLLVCSEPAWGYAYEARPYGLLLGFMMLGLVSWQSATRPDQSAKARQLALAGIAVALLGGILSHNIGVVEVGIPLLFGEVVRVWKARRVDWTVVAIGGVSSSIALAIILPFMHRTSALLMNYSRARSRSLLHPFTIQKFYKFWIAYPLQSVNLLFDFGLATILLFFLAGVTIGAWAFAKVRSSAQPRALEPVRHHRIQIHILAGAAGACLLIPITLVLMMLQNGWYFARYGIGSAIGIPILVCLLLHEHVSPRLWVPLAAGLSVLLSAQFCYPLIYFLRHPQPRASATYTVYADGSSLPIAVADPVGFLPMWYYAPDPVKQRLVYLKDVAFSTRVGYAVADFALISEEGLFPAQFAEYRSFLQSNDHFILYLPGVMVPYDLEVSRLQSAGFRLTPIREFPGDRIYDVQRVN